MLVRRFHFILLVIQLDRRQVLVVDSKHKSLETLGDMIDTL
jgi:hypothetical protein